MSRTFVKSPLAPPPCFHPATLLSLYSSLLNYCLLWYDFLSMAYEFEVVVYSRFSKDSCIKDEGNDESFHYLFVANDG